MYNINVDPNKFAFEILPLYADFILREKHKEYVIHTIRFAREENLPIMKQLERFSEEELLAISLESSRELLLALAEKTIHRYIEENVKKWIANKLDIIDKSQIAAEDLTLVAFIRRKALSCFLSDFTDNKDIKIQLIHEIDIYTTQEEMVSYNAYINMQQEKINKANEQLAFQESLLLEAQEITNMASFYVDYVNPENSHNTPQMGKITGLPENSKSHDFFKFVHPDDVDQLRAAWDNAFNNGGSFHSSYRYINEGTQKKLVSKGIVQIENGKPINLRGTLRDITQEDELIRKLTESERKLVNLNASLFEKNSELVNSNKELESFNYIASHDLQEPLRKIQLFTGRLMDQADNLSEEMEQSLKKVVFSAARMQRLIADLIEFSQVSSPSEAFEKRDLNELVEEVKNTTLDNAENTHAVFHISKLPEAEVIPFQFSQLLTNIISNALKYKKENTIPEITIKSEMTNSEKEPGIQHGSYLKLSICDNGIGFEPEQKDNIFDLFKRLHANEKYSGTGIGLAICKKIAGNHHGFIKAESEKGKGSCFHIYLPEVSVTA